MANRKPLTTRRFSQLRRLEQALVDAAAWLLGLVLTLGLFWPQSEHHLAPGRRFVVAVAIIGVHLGVALRLGLYRGRFWYGSSREIARLYVATAAAMVTGIVLSSAAGGGGHGVLVVFEATPVMLCLVQLARVVRYLRRRRTVSVNPHARRMIVFGAGEGGAMALRTLFNSRTTPFVPVALLDDDPSRRRLEIDRVRVMGGRDDIARVAQDLHADAMLIAIPSATSETLLELTELGRKASLEVFVLPPAQELFGAVAAEDIRPVTEADLLGRHPVEIDTAAIARFITGRTVLVTGAGGTIGSELCRQIVRFFPASLHMLDCDDSALAAVELSIQGRALLQDAGLLLADIRDRVRMFEVMNTVRPDVVFHAAALKHLSLLERYPTEAWKTNVEGGQNLLDAALAAGVEHFVNISTDKAADPISVLGWSKRITERQTSHAALMSGRPYVSVRFGNVLGSRGSVLEIFAAQLEAGGPLTVTDPDVTRYFMTVAEAVRLTLSAAAEGSGGEVLVLDMGEPVRIADVARRLADAAPRPIEIQFTGLRPGEKLHEVLVASGEIATRPQHPKVSHVSVPPLDVPRFSALSDRQHVTVEDLIDVATAPAAGPEAVIEHVDGPRAGP